MSHRLVRLGLHVVNLDALANCHWEGPKLIVRYIGGGFDVLHGGNAKALWRKVAADLPELNVSGEPGAVPDGGGIAAGSGGPSQSTDLRPAV
jgi:hypothetical protein